MDWLGTYLLGVITLPAAAALVGLLHWALQRSSIGYGPCDFCTHRGGKNGYEPGERLNFQRAIDMGLHRFFWARLPKHKRAFGDWWRSRESKNFINRRWDPRYMR